MFHVKDGRVLTQTERIFKTNQLYYVRSCFFDGELEDEVRE